MYPAGLLDYLLFLTTCERSYSCLLLLLLLLLLSGLGLPCQPLIHPYPGAVRAQVAA